MYEGGHKNDQMHGDGTYRWPNGAIYNGKYQFGQKSGRGKLTDASGTVLQDGIWENDMYCGNGIPITKENMQSKQREKTVFHQHRTWPLY